VAYVDQENAKVFDVTNGCVVANRNIAFTLTETELDESQDSDFEPSIEIISQTSCQASSTPFVTKKPKLQLSNCQKNHSVVSRQKYIRGKFDPPHLPSVANCEKKCPGSKENFL